MMMRQPNQGMMPQPMMPNPAAMQQQMMQNQMMQQQAAAGQTRDSAWLKNNTDEFNALPANEQKTLLGTLMYNQVKKYAPQDQVPKITGMLIDLEVLDIQEIADILNDDKTLQERISEAMKIIEEDGTEHN